MRRERLRGHDPRSNGDRWKAHEGDRVEGITIQAASPDSARRMVVALSRFHPSCAEDGSEVIVGLSGEKGELVAVLDALEAYVTARETGPTRLRLDGRSYVLEADGSAG